MSTTESITLTSEESDAWVRPVMTKEEKAAYMRGRRHEYRTDPEWRARQAFLARVSYLHKFNCMAKYESVCPCVTYDFPII